MLCHSLLAHGTGKRHFPRVDTACVLLLLSYLDFWLVVHKKIR